MKALLIETSTHGNLSRFRDLVGRTARVRRLWIASLSVLLGCSGGSEGPGTRVRRAAQDHKAAQARPAPRRDHDGGHWQRRLDRRGGLDRRRWFSRPRGLDRRRWIAWPRWLHRRRWLRTGGRAARPASLAPVAGRGGSTGIAGSPGTGGGTPVATNQSVLERNKNPSRDGHFIQPTLTKTAADDDDGRYGLQHRGDLQRKRRLIPALHRREQWRWPVLHHHDERQRHRPQRERDEPVDEEHRRGGHRRHRLLELRTPSRWASSRRQ